MQAVAAADPALARFIDTVGPPEERAGSGDAFIALARAIVFQQLAGRAAAAIYARTEAAVGGRLSPQAVLATSPLALRGAGLSATKTAGLLDLAMKTGNGSVPLDELAALDDDEIVARLITVRGVGRWTAQMFLLFELRRSDVWPVDDLGVRTGWSLIHDQPLPTPRQLSAAGEPFRPHRSLVARYCWQAVHVARANGGVLGGTGAG
jgi:DNA-3-methyladenine glycosylase II